MPESTWSLFFDVIVTGTLLACVLPFLGTLLLLRRELFLGAAVAQSGSLGIAAVLALSFDDGGAHGVSGPGWPLLGGMGAAMAAGVVAMRSGAMRNNSLQAGAAWLFLFGGSAAMVLLAGAPHGMQTVQQVMLSSLLGATRFDAVVALVLLSGTIIVFVAFGRPLLLWAMDPVTAKVHGWPVNTIDLLVGAAIGGVLGFSIHATGLPFTFGATVLPVLAARELARSLRGVLVLAPLLSGAMFLVAWWWADVADLPPGQCAVVLLAVVVVLARGVAASGWTRR